MYITNNVDVAKIAEANGVDMIFIDLETNGKEERQGHLDTVISNHHMDDIREIKEILTKSKVLVRINPLHENTEIEINTAIKNGADILMLPFFKTKSEVEKFIELVNGRVETMLLLETSEAAEAISEIIKINGIDYIHIGLNDLHLSYNLNFMFELISNGTVEKIVNKIKEQNIPFGFGGIAQLGKGELSSEIILAEHFRLGSEMTILSRSFCDANKKNNLTEISLIFDIEINKIKEYQKYIKSQPSTYFIENLNILKKITSQIVNQKVNANEDFISNRY